MNMTPFKKSVAMLVTSGRIDLHQWSMVGFGWDMRMRLRKRKRNEVRIGVRPEKVLSDISNRF
jgi:hypothetical protein